jgi:hypothetical protein
MYSYKHFTPGGNLKCGKMISYSQAANINPNIKTCTYINSEIMNKSFLTNNISNSQRISQIINSSVGGSTQFGSYYLGEPVVFNYLGRVEGQPGGSGAPLRNRF